jgi:hypothetical protein
VPAGSVTRVKPLAAGGSPGGGGGGTTVTIRVGVGDGVDVLVGVAVGDGVCRGVGVCVAGTTFCTTFRGRGVSAGVGVFVDPGFGVCVGVGVWVGLGVGVCVGVRVGVRVGVGVAVFVGVAVAVGVGVEVLTCPDGGGTTGPEGVFVGRGVEVGTGVLVGGGVGVAAWQGGWKGSRPDVDWLALIGPTWVWIPLALLSSNTPRIPTTLDADKEAPPHRLSGPCSASVTEPPTGRMQLGPEALVAELGTGLQLAPPAPLTLMTLIGVEPLQGR